MPILRQREDLSDELLEELGSALRSDLPDAQWWFDTVALELHLVTAFDEEELAEEPRETRPQWERDQLVRARELATDTTGRYLELPRLGQRPRLSEFVRSIRDPALREAARDAMHGGQGGYRRVKALLDRRGQIELWHRFEQEQALEEALSWLRDEGVLPASEDADGEE